MRRESRQRIAVQYYEDGHIKTTVEYDIDRSGTVYSWKWSGL